MGEKASNLKSGIHAEIPGLGRREIRSIVSDYSGTLSRGGRLADGVEERLLKLLEVVDVHILTSDTFGTAREELRRIPAHVMILIEEHHDIQKQEYVRSRCDPRHTAAFGNGNNDRLLLKTVKEASGIAVAVDNGEGCATETLLNANLFISGAANALDLLLDPKRLKATLRF